MGEFTTAEIITEGLELAGDTSLTLRALNWLNMSLRRVYAQHPWPFLKTRYGPITLTAGSSSFLFGNGSNTVDKILRIERIRVASPTNNSFKGEMLVNDDEDTDAADDPSWLDSNSSGLPSRALIEAEPTVAHSWTVSFETNLDKAYRVLIRARRLPEYVDPSEIPVYPSDATMIHMVYVYALRHMTDERWIAEEQILNQMVTSDKVTFKAGVNSKVRLSRRKFNRRRTSSWLKD